MIGKNLTRIVEFTRVSSALIAGSTVHNVTAYDMSGYEGVAFLVNMGALTTGTVVNAHIEMATSSGGTYSDISGSAANLLSTQFSDDAWLITEAYRPRDRWVRCVIDRASANAVINSVMMARYGANQSAVTHSTAGIAAVTFVLGNTTGSAT